ncbi:MAG: hypothetical protein EHM20_06660 [Alphaproteobacteria bacterium]|nr:MAG: hypothetical protein EHM20_06660 [Alphaproteobacteria bacterium]
MIDNIMNELFFDHYRDNRGELDLAPNFSNQGVLFETLEKNRNNCLIRSGVNILTIRLLLAQDSFRRLQDYEQRYKRLSGDYIVKDPVTALSGVVAPILSPYNFIGEEIKTETIRAHEYFYSFLTSAVSALDRLANEIDSIYELNIRKVDWGSLKNGFSALESTNSNLKQYLTTVMSESNQDVKLLFDYRNIAEHEGAVIIEEFSRGRITMTDSYTIKVQSDPRDPNSTINRELVNTCRIFFCLVVNICDRVYDLIAQNLFNVQT